ncbi:uncharacterized protein PHACADRAFT_249233 [Phanerochaete carnosa HHB-10118-sp]|uniref:DUF6534 domain-containing protein n=1 Tax=Phanerochaete carnosa (strain HHB-10118-sp) TaxID=650164 RepID=K5WIV6_PHACS|nr:uncharacterized protein PHACADRAFT_249233 [Phanerochaete carnosa HHB-10118-sp]EKM59054.1 hypothetical protein PHACADRAFT_249233 [Phanerochaete carnosa HHB-10118-sp]
MHLSPGGEVAEVLHGPSLIGIFLNLLLYGVVVTQVRSYYDSFPKDPTWMKIYVGVLLLADTLNSAFNMAWIYNVLVNHFGDMEALTEANWLFASEEAMAGIIAVMVQLFFAWRLKVLTKNRFVVAVVVCSSSVAGLCAIGTAIGITMKPHFSDFHVLNAVAIPWLVACTMSDVLIALALSLYLRKHKTGFAHTDTVVNKIVRSTVQNGLLTASFTVAHIVAFLASPTGIHMIFNYTVVKLYTNSVISSLNSRKEWMVSLSGEGNRGGAAMANFMTTNQSIHQQVVTINIETHETVDVDSDPKHDPEWPDMAGSRPSAGKRGVSGDPKAYAV